MIEPWEERAVRTRLAAGLAEAGTGGGPWGGQTGGTAARPDPPVGDGGFGAGGGGGGGQFTVHLGGHDGGAGGFGGGGGGAGYDSVCLRSRRSRRLRRWSGQRPDGVHTPAAGAGLGGAIFSNGGSISLTNDTLTANSATGGTGGNVGSGYGGAVFALNGGLTANFDTFSANIAQDGASTPLDGTDVYVLGDLEDTGVRGNGNVTAGLTDDILGQSTYGTSDFVANYVNTGSFSLSGQYDLISNNGPTITGNITGFTGMNVSNVATGAFNGLALADNGGPTETIALSAPIPGTAIAGITTDQRGVVRDAPPDEGPISTRR